MTFLEAMERIPIEDVIEDFDNPKATFATLRAWWHSLPEGERLAFAEEVSRYDHALELAWLNAYDIFRRKLTPSEWLEGKARRRAELYGVRRKRMAA